MLLRYILAWFPMVVIAIGNGALREKSYGRRMSELHAHQVSCLTGIVLFGSYIGALSRLWPLPNDAEAWAVGAVWLALTIAFEFLFGHFVARHSWGRLLHDYNLCAGRLWLFVLVFVAIAPLLFRHV